jgi:hypothetical protein
MWAKPPEDGDILTFETSYFYHFMLLLFSGASDKFRQEQILYE